MCNWCPETAYYWYVGTTEPTELNGAVANAETDKWVEIGTEMPSYINVETANKYDYWYVLMPTEFDFCQEQMRENGVKFSRNSQIQKQVYILKLVKVLLI